MGRKPCCGSGLPPKIEEGRHVHVEGLGTPQDPLIISATTELSVQDNATFNLILDGNGTLEAPWQLQVAFAPTASIDDFADVDLAGAANGYVLTYDLATDTWKPGPPSTVPPGSVLHGNGVTGDGSSGAPLAAVGDGARYITVTAAGIGLNDGGLNALIRPFADATARASASPAPVVGTISVLASNPDQLDYFDGSTWIPITGGHSKDIQPGQLLSLSGAYAGGRTTDYVAQLSVVTDSTGAFEIIANTDLTGYSGVLHCEVQETGNTAWKCMVKAGTNNITGVARRLDSGAVFPGATLTGTVRALLY